MPATAAAMSPATVHVRYKKKSKHSLVRTTSVSTPATTRTLATHEQVRGVNATHCVGRPWLQFYVDEQLCHAVFN
jgi:hypothetical protein